MTGMRGWQSGLLNKVRGVFHFFGGVGFDVEGPEDLPAVLRVLGLPDDLYILKQVHSPKVLVGERDLVAGAMSSEGDGIVITGRGRGGVVFTADCIPLFLVAREEPVGALVHAGWRGIAEGVVGNALFTLSEYFSVPADRVVASLGPAIGGCCFEVGFDIADQFRKSWPGSVTDRQGGKPRVDLKKVVVRVLIEGGVGEESIDVCPLCTFCGEGYHSYRRNRSSVKRQISVLYFPELNE